MNSASEKEHCLPVKYSLEVYEGSFRNDPSWHLGAAEPFLSIHAGDYFNTSLHDGWAELPGPKKRFRVKEVEHIIWEIKGSHIGHKVMVLLEIVAEAK